MKRFNDTEELEFHSEVYSHGIEARLLDRPITDNPYTGREWPEWLRKSWAAGWADADMDPESPANSRDEEKL